MFTEKEVGETFTANNFVLKCTRIITPEYDFVENIGLGPYAI